MFVHWNLQIIAEHYSVVSAFDSLMPAKASLDNLQAFGIILVVWDYVLKLQILLVKVTLEYSYAS